MNEEKFAIKEIWQKGAQTLGIIWTDGLESSYSTFHLRANCPCAHCVDEQTNRRTLNPDLLDPTVKPVTVKSVGLYAISIVFDDGHSTGIYTFEKLRQLDQAIHGGKVIH